MNGAAETGRDGIDRGAVMRRVIAGIVLGLTVVAIDRVMGFGS